MQRGECILVFGVSGVGKTSSCEAFSRRHPEFLYLRASRLLSEAMASTPEQLRASEASRIIANQRLLEEEFRRKRSREPERPVILDAHGVIDNDRELVRVPVETIASLEPDGFILLEATTEAVQARRLGDVRERPLRTVADIEDEIRAERAAVLDYASELELPLETALVTEGFHLEDVMTMLYGRLNPRHR